MAKTTKNKGSYMTSIHPALKATEIAIDRTIQAWMKCIADEDRYGLNAIYADGDKGVLVATNGHLLVRLDMPHYKGPCVMFRIKGNKLTQRGVAVVDLAALVKGRKVGENEFTTVVSSDSKVLTIEGWSASDNEFPDYAAVLPNEGARARAAFGLNPKLLLLVQNALGCDKTDLVQRGDAGSPIAVYPGLDEGFSGVVMPMRSEDERVLKSLSNMDESITSSVASTGDLVDEVKGLEKRLAGVQEALDLALHEEKELRRQRDEALAERDSARRHNENQPIAVLGGALKHDVNEHVVVPPGDGLVVFDDSAFVAGGVS